MVDFVDEYIQNIPPDPAATDIVMAWWMHTKTPVLELRVIRRCTECGKTGFHPDILIIDDICEDTP